MPTATSTMGNTLGQFLKYEAPQGFSRDNITVLSGQNLLAGSVLGRVTLDGTTATIAAAAGNTGNGTATMDATRTSAGVKPGVYRAICVEPITNLGTFAVIDPDGVLVGRAFVGTLFAGPVRFTIADGATDFVAGDIFDITVPVGSLKVVGWDPAGADGRQNAVGILCEAVNATGGDVASVMVARQAEIVARDALVWPNAATNSQRDAALTALRALGIVSRTTV